MMMSNDDIYASWKEAKNKSQQVRILAELNSTTDPVIKGIIDDCEARESRNLAKIYRDVPEKAKPSSSGKSSKHTNVSKSKIEVAPVTGEKKRSKYTDELKYKIVECIIAEIPYARIFDILEMPSGSSLSGFQQLCVKLKTEYSQYGRNIYFDESTMTQFDASAFVIKDTGKGKGKIAEIGVATKSSKTITAEVKESKSENSKKVSSREPNSFRGKPSTKLSGTKEEMIKALNEEESITSADIEWRRSALERCRERIHRAEHDISSLTRELEFAKQQKVAAQTMYERLKRGLNDE